MVASFGRCKYRLSDISVANLLNACLGGVPEEFRVINLRDRTFRFSVTSRFIGFHIAKLLSFTCSAFVVFFHLWGFGGPNYVREFEDWCLEERNSWTTPKPDAKIIGTDVLTGTNQVLIGRKSVFQRLESPLMSPCSPLVISPKPPPSATTARASPAMANFPVNSARFIHGLYDVIDVAGRPQQSRFHLSSRTVDKNEDLAIATIESPLPLDEPFLNIEDAIEKCPLGDAYVRLMSASIRDWLVLHSPHQHNNQLICFCEHNKGINWRAFNFNQEVWLMLLAFPFDNWTYENISYAVADWGRLVHWDKAASTLARVIIKVKIADLSHIPFSIVVTNGEDMQGESWIVPVFIVSQRLLDGQPQDDDLPPPNGATPHPLPTLDSPQICIMCLCKADNAQMVEHAVALAPQIHIFDVDAVDNHMQADNAQMLADLDDLNDDSEVTLSLSLNAPAISSEGFTSVNLHNHQANQNVIVGRVEIPEFSHSPDVFTCLQGPHLTYPQMEKLHISGEGPWINFFTAMLMSPEEFEWARKVLRSNMCQAFSAGQECFRAFSIPERCLADTPISCKLPNRVTANCQGFTTPQAYKHLALSNKPHASASTLRVRKARKPPNVVTEVRRSPRLSKKQVRFKHKSCIDRDCLTCSAIPPKVSKKIVRSVGERFGLVTEEDSHTDESIPNNLALPNDKAAPKKKKQRK
ncbi:hypothetical protein BRADI_1g14575v3 [Brachypodium distachyon]|uniref:DUF7597 domain-containing protein n=1 Tax=Brachypodium distachyon TaxID=15368 RepID=A0A0Q3GTE1_BRADI|nr:hypothetical protein BRADI_1g14575v3 [Brachypodium distachyon]